VKGHHLIGSFKHLLKFSLSLLTSKRVRKLL